MRTIVNNRASAPSHVGSDDISTDAPCYLLFAGVSNHPPLGGLGDLVRTFTCEAAARDAFHQLREQEGPKGTWAQLAIIDVRSGVRPVCWFGTGPAGRAQHLLGGSSDVAGAPRSATTRNRRWMERYRRHTGRGRLLARQRR